MCRSSTVCMCRTAEYFIVYIWSLPLDSIHYPPTLFPCRSNNSDTTVRSTESVGVRQPAKSKIRRHNNRLSTVFNHSPNLRDSGRRGQAQGSSSLSGDLQTADDPAELSSQMSVPGILKIFGSDICQGTNYKSVLATTQSSAKELVKEALERWELSPLYWWILLLLSHNLPDLIPTFIVKVLSGKRGPQRLCALRCDRPDGQR